MIIRRRQTEILGAGLRRAFLERAVEHFREHFAAKTTSPGWEEMVDRSMTRAESVYALRNERDQCLFLDLCGAYGWDFDGTPENAWMRRALLDERLSCPGDRVRRVVQLALEREAIARQNAELRQRFLTP